jgi:DNA-binding CsgD family transcriptional regulator
MQGVCRTGSAAMAARGRVATAAAAGAVRVLRPAPAPAWWLAPGGQAPSAPASQGAALSGALLQPVLDALGCGLLLLDAAGQVLHANRAAQLLCTAGAPLVLHEDGLVLSVDDEHRLCAALQGAQRGQWAMLALRGSAPWRDDEEVGTVAVGVVPLPAEAEAPPHGGAVVDRTDRAGALPQDGHKGQAVAMLVLGPQRMTGGLALQFFCREHELTRAECLVLQALCDGETPAEVAGKTGVSLSTVRTHIQSMRQKARAQSIRHLVQMVGSLPPLMGSALSGPR